MKQSVLLNLLKPVVEVVERIELATENRPVRNYTDHHSKKA